MIRSASGTDNLPSACMKSYWVSTSQKMTRAISDLPWKYDGVGESLGEESSVSTGRRRLQPQHNCYLIATVLSRAPRAVRPHLEREVLPLGGCEADLQKEPGFAGQREHFGEALHARLGDQRREQRAAHARPLPIRAHGECGELRQIARVHLERPATDDLARRCLRDDVFLDVPTEIVIRAWQEVAGGNVGRHQELELRDVGKHRDRKSTRLNSSHGYISYAVFCLKKKKKD